MMQHLLRTAHTILALICGIALMASARAALAAEGGHTPAPASGPVLVLGHKRPDTDSIMSAIAVAHLLNARGIPAAAAAQGPIVPETAFALKKLGLTAPEICTSVAGKRVVLVDFSDATLAPDDLGKAEIIGIVDHHKLGDITTNSQLFAWIWPVGCTATVVKGMYDYYGIAMPKGIAGACLSAILSDTVLFKSPSTTPEDKKAAHELAKIAGIDSPLIFGMEMFKAKSDIAGASAKELLFRDYKEFDLAGKKVGIGQIEVIDPSVLDSIKDALAQEVTAAQREGKHTVLLLLTDISRGGSEVLASSASPDIVQKVFGNAANGAGKPVWLPGVMSRKKDVIPVLAKALETLP